MWNTGKSREGSGRAASSGGDERGGAARCWHKVATRAPGSCREARTRAGQVAETADSECLDLVTSHLIWLSPFTWILRESVYCVSWFIMWNCESNNFKSYIYDLKEREKTEDSLFEQEKKAQAVIRSQKCTHFFKYVQNLFLSLVFNL